MKKSARAMRMERHHKRMAKESKLSLVSLMDIFTILVFFLMVNASEVQVLQNSKSVELPESIAQQSAKETLILMVNNNDLILQGKKLVDVSSILSQSDDLIPELAIELKYQVNRTANSGEKDADSNDIEKAITIMGDKNIPYALLKRIMQTCAQAGFINISLAVAGQEISGQSSESKVNDASVTRVEEI
jgi:biopolymer transport protein TolR